MKFATIAGLLSFATAIDIETPQNEEALEQQDYEMSQLCQNMDQIDEDSLVEVNEDEESAPKKKYVKKVRSTYKKHYGLTKKAIDAENNHILNTQATCMKFVKKYRGHPKVCDWCKQAKAPSVIWKWDATGKVWFRWYDNKWHYWGPSKHGFTAQGWTWYKGFWHHNGWVFKHEKGMWWRFQGHKWVKYSRTVTINPTPPRGPKICRPFFMLKKWGFPTSLGAKTLPRCKVGAGKAAIWYMWKDRANCRFLGGKLVYQKIKTCKTGRPHQWAKVTRCVRGPILSKKGLNYKTGKGIIKSKKVAVYQDRRSTPVSTVYADRDSGAQKDCQITKISKVTKNCFALGDYAVAKYSAPSKKIMHRYCTNAKKVSTVFRKPLSFTKGWDDRGVNKVRNGSFWIPNCPKGFNTLGSLGLTIKNGKTPTSANFKQFRCIAQKFTERARYGKLIWSDKGSGGKYDARIYSIDGSPFFMSTKLNKKKISAIFRLAYTIKGKGY